MASGKVAKSRRGAKLARAGEGRLMVMKVGRALPDFPEYTGEQVARLLDDTGDYVNRLLREAGLRNEAIAEFLFKTWYLNSVRLALDPKAPVPPGVNELLQRAGASIELTSYEVRRYVKVAALNHHVREGLWRNLLWTTKLELVRLVKGADDLSLFARGVVFANKANVGPDHVRRWVDDVTNGPSDSPGRPRGLTVAGAGKAAAPVVRLSDPDARERFVERVAALDDDARERLLDELRTAAENLGKVLDEVNAKVSKRTK